MTLHEAFTFDEFMWFYDKMKYKNFNDFHLNAYARDGVRAVAIHPMQWKKEWGIPDYVVFNFKDDDFVEMPEFFTTSAHFNFVTLYHYQYYVEEFIYGIREVFYNVVAIVSAWEAMSTAYRDLLNPTYAGGDGFKELVEQFEPLDMKNERNFELCRMALAGEHADHEYPECEDRLKFGECGVSKTRVKCLQLLDENKCPLSKIWGERKTNERSNNW